MTQPAQSGDGGTLASTTGHRWGVLGPVRVWIQAGRYDAVTVALFTRGVLLLCSPALYVQTGVTQSWSRLGILALMFAWIGVLAWVHQQQRDITSPRWLSADVAVTSGYLVLVSLHGPRSLLDPVLLGPVLIACAAGPRTARAVGAAVTCAFAAIAVTTAVIDDLGVVRPVLLSAALAVVAVIVVPAVGPPWSQRLDARLKEAFDQVTKPSTELLARVAAAAERTDAMLHNALEFLAAEPAPTQSALARVRRSHAERERNVRALFEEARAQVLVEAAGGGAAGRAVAAGGSRRPRRPAGGSRGGLLRRMRVLRVLRRRRARGRELLPQRVVAEDLFVLALVVRLWLLVQAGLILYRAEELGHPAYIVLAVWWAVLCLLWWFGHPFLLEDGFRLAIALDVLVGAATALLAGGVVHQGLFPALVGAVLLAATRGWRRGLVAAVVMIAATVGGLAIAGWSVTALDGTSVSALRVLGGEAAVFLAWGLGAGAAASAALIVAGFIEDGGQSRSVLALGRVHRSFGPAKLTDVALEAVLDADGLNPVELARLRADHEESMRQYAAVMEDRTVEVGRLPLTVNSAIRSEIKTTAARIARQRELTVDLSHAQPLYNRRECMIVAEVVRELLVNAHVHTDAGPIRLSSDLEHGHWVVRVRDPGHGHERAGTGFGLAYYDNCVRRLDGSLETATGAAVLRMPLVRLWSASGPKGDSPLSAALAVTAES